MSHRPIRVVGVAIPVLVAAGVIAVLSRNRGSGDAGVPASAPATGPASSPAGTPGVSTRPAVPWDPPRPPAARERVEERAAMVERQIAHPFDGRPAVSAARVLEAMRDVPRHVFVPRNQRDLAYADRPLPIGHGQTISQPYIVALMTELLKLGPEAMVLEIGTGSGYQAAVLAHLTPHVYTIEIVKPLAERAEETLREQGYKGIRCRQADGYNGWPEAAPFDAIIVTCAAGHLPPPLWDQLAAGGRIVIPIGGPYEVQRLVVITKTADGRRESETILPVQFVPLTRQ